MAGGDDEHGVGQGAVLCVRPCVLLCLLFLRDEDASVTTGSNKNINEDK